MDEQIGRVGVWSPSWFWKGDDSGDAAAELEELGFGALWLGMAPGDLDIVESLLRATSTLTLATGIVNVWTEPAGSTAAAYRRVAGRYPGRLLLGIGAGHKEMVERATGQQYVRPYEKVSAYLDELDAVAQAVPGADRALAALGPRMLGLAGTRTAGAHPFLVPVEHTRRARETLGDGPLLAPEQKVVLETDPDAARRVARTTLSHYLALPNYTNNLLRLGYTDDDVAGGGSDRLVDDLVARGDADAVRERIEQHHRAGADHVCLQLLSEQEGHPREQFRELGRALFG